MSEQVPVSVPVRAVPTQPSLESRTQFGVKKKVQRSLFFLHDTDLDHQELLARAAEAAYLSRSSGLHTADNAWRKPTWRLPACEKKNIFAGCRDAVLHATASGAWRLPLLTKRKKSLSGTTSFVPHVGEKRKIAAPRDLDRVVL